MRRLYTLYLTLLLIKGAFLQLGADSGVVTDGQGQTSERDNESVAKIAIIVTSVACALATILCVGACAYCCYQKCCIEGFSI